MTNGTVLNLNVFSRILMIYANIAVYILEILFLICLNFSGSNGQVLNPAPVPNRPAPINNAVNTEPTEFPWTITFSVPKPDLPM